MLNIALSLCLFGSAGAAHAQESDDPGAYNSDGKESIRECSDLLAYQLKIGSKLDSPVEARHLREIKLNGGIGIERNRFADDYRQPGEFRREFNYWPNGTTFEAAATKACEHYVAAKRMADEMDEFIAKGLDAPAHYKVCAYIPQKKKDELETALKEAKQQAARQAETERIAEIDKRRRDEEIKKIAEIKRNAMEQRGSAALNRAAGLGQSFKSPETDGPDGVSPGSNVSKGGSMREPPARIELPVSDPGSGGGQLPSRRIKEPPSMIPAGIGGVVQAEPLPPEKPRGIGGVKQAPRAESYLQRLRRCMREAHASQARAEPQQPTVILAGIGGVKQAPSSYYLEVFRRCMSQ